MTVPGGVPPGGGRAGIGEVRERLRWSRPEPPPDLPDRLRDRLRAPRPGAGGQSPALAVVYMAGGLVLLALGAAGAAGVGPLG